MADEQVHQTGTIDDAIRQAEKQLERRIEELRTLAGGDDPIAQGGGEPAKLRPTGGAIDVESDTGAIQPLSEPQPVVDEDAWEDEVTAGAVVPDAAPWNDVQHDVQPSWTPPIAETWEPEAPEGDIGEETPQDGPQPSVGGRWEDEPVDEPEPLAPEPLGSGFGAEPAGPDLEPAEDQPEPEFEPGPSSFEPAPSSYGIEAGGTYESEPDPYGASAALAPYTSGASAYMSRSIATAATPTPEETEFWTHTRTALRLLQQQADELRHELPNEVTRRIRDDVSRDMTKRMGQQLGATLGEQVERIVRDEMSSQAASIRQLQQQLPTYADRIERTVADELQSAGANVKQLSEELPGQFQRIERTMSRVLAEDLNKIDRSLEEKSTQSHAAMAGQFEHIELTMRGELGKLEQFVRNELETPATQLQQLTEQLPGQFQRVERSVKDGTEHTGEQIDRVGQALAEQQRQVLELLDSVKSHREQLATQLDALSSSYSQQLAEFAASSKEQIGSFADGSREQLQRHHEEIVQQSREAQQELHQHQETLADRVTRSIVDDLAPAKLHLRELVDLDMGNAMGDIALASRLVLDKLGAMSGDLDQDRVQRAEDLELMIDTLTSATQGVYGAINRVFDRVGEFNERMDSVEQRMSSIGALERAVEKGLSAVFHQLEGNLTQMQSHLRELQPAPVVVTVNHPEASVAQETRAGYVLGGSKGPGAHDA